MPVNNYPIDRTKTGGMQLSNLIDTANRFLEQLDLVRGKMIAAGYDDSTASDGSLFGLGSTASAHAVFVQLDTVAGNIGLPITSPSGTVNKADVYASINQMIDQVG